MQTFAFISLGAPLMLLGIAAIALPIAAHLMSRRTRQRIVFPTIRLLMESRATQSNLFRIRRWILLLLRCLALIMIAVAFTMPSCTPHRANESGDQNSSGGAAVVFLIDLSASMNRDPQTTGGTTLLHSMQAIAQRTLASLEPGLDRVNVVFAQGKPMAMFQSPSGKPMLSTNHAAVHEGLRAMELTYERADLRAAMALAGDMLREATDASQRRLVVLSDMQQSNWSDLDFTLKDASPLPAGTVITMLPLKVEDASNIALLESRSEPAMPVVNQQTLLIAKVTNYSARARDVVLSAQLDGQPIGMRTVALAARETREVSFDITLTTAGRHRVEFALPDDALPIDNRHYLSVEATQRVQAVVVGDDDPASLGSASYFIARALSPRGDRNDLIEVRHLNGIDVAEADLSRAQVVVISQVNELSDTACSKIAQYLHQGGGVLFFSEGPSVPVNVSALENAFQRVQQGQGVLPDGAAGSAKFMPWKPVQLRDFSSSSTPMRISEGVWNSPVLAEFDEQAQQTLSQIRFHRVWSLQDVHPLATVLLRFSDSTPAMAQMNIGSGRWIVANFSPSLVAGDLGKYGTFVALSHSLVRYLRPRLDWRSTATIGRSVVASVPIPVGEQAGAFVIEAPQGRLITPELSRTGSSMSVVMPPSRTPGFHRILRNDRPVGDVAVNIDARESDLRALDEATMAGALKSEGIAIDLQSPLAASDVLELRGQPLWHWFIIAAMGFIAVELALLSVWNR